MRFPLRRRLLPCLLLGLSASAWARELTDVTGAKISLVDQPARIVTLAPSLGELAADIVGAEDGGLDRIVGVTEYTDYPPRLKKARSVGPYHRFNVEAVLVLKPDLVLATRDGNLKDQIDHLRELKLPVVVVSTESLKEVEASMRLVGEALGAKAEGQRMAEQFLTGLKRIRERAQKRKPRKVVLQVSDKPVVVAGRKSFLQDALEAVGAENAYGDVSATYPRPSTEDFLSRNPDVIIVLALGSDLKPFRGMARAWTQFPSLKAVHNKEVFVLQGDAVTRPTLRLLEGLSQLEKLIHGGAKADGNP